MLYHLLPVVFWLLAIGGIVLWAFLSPQTFHWTSLLPALLAWLAVLIISRIKRHSNSVEECFQVALLLGIAAYWLPSVLSLLIAVWIYLIYQNLFSFRSFLASLIGLAVVAIWIIVLTQLSIINYPLSISYNLWAWIPTGATLLAWLASTIARQNLRVR